MDQVINHKDMQALKVMIVEMTKCLQTIDGEREQMKEIAEAAEEKFGIKKKYINKVARVMFKHNYADIQSENDHFQDLYETVAEGKKVSDISE